MKVSWGCIGFYFFLFYHLAVDTDETPASTSTFRPACWSTGLVLVFFVLGKREEQKLHPAYPGAIHVRSIRLLEDSREELSFCATISRTHIFRLPGFVA